MRRVPKVKSLVPPVTPRKAAITASAAARRMYPAWIDADERTVAFPATTATPRVRDALILRKVAGKKSGKLENRADGTRNR